VIPQRYFSYSQNKSQTVDDLKLSDNPLILVAEAPEQKHRYCRTADAAHLDAAIIASDLYNLILCVLV
jgi:TrmH family RNA methyltransferase